MRKYPFSIPFKMGKWFIVIINFISLFSVIYIWRNNNFNSDSLKDLATFSISTVFAFAALMLSVFSFKTDSKSNNSSKLKENVVSYLVDAILAVSIAVLCYVSSFIFILPAWTVKTLATITIMLIVHMLTHSVAFLVAHFNLP